MNDDADTIRRALGILGSAPGSPAMQALERLTAVAERYEWVRPLVSGENDPDGHYKMFRLGSAFLRGRKGEDAITDAMT